MIKRTVDVSRPGSRQRGPLAVIEKRRPRSSRFLPHGNFLSHTDKLGAGYTRHLRPLVIEYILHPLYIIGAMCPSSCIGGLALSDGRWATEDLIACVCGPCATLTLTKPTLGGAASDWRLSHPQCSKVYFPFFHIRIRFATFGCSAGGVSKTFAAGARAVMSSSDALSAVPLDRTLREDVIEAQTHLLQVVLLDAR